MKTTLIAILVLILTPVFVSAGDSFRFTPQKRSEWLNDSSRNFYQRNDQQQQPQRNVWQEQLDRELYESTQRQQQRRLLKRNVLENTWESVPQNAWRYQLNGFTGKWELIE